MAHFGHYISGAGHAGLIGFLLVGPVFTAEPLPFEVSNVSIVTAEEFAALALPSDVAPEVPAVLPQTPEQPAPEPEPVPAPTPEPEPAPAPAPTPVPPPTPAPPPTPEPAPTPPPAPVAPPAPAQPQPEVTTIVPPETVQVPNPLERSQRPRLRPAERVAPEPVAQPDPETTIAEEVQEAVTSEPGETAAEAVEEQEATSPEEAAPEIVTEAEEGTPAAPIQSMRPRVRPQSQVAEATPQDAPEETGESVNSAVEDALAGLLDASAETPAPSGAPLTSGERDGLVLAVRDCWSVDIGSPAADVVVTVGFSLTREGQVQGDIRQIAATGGDARAQEVAFGAARRAVLRCAIQQGGYDLPVEKYEQWKDVEITFNPETMRIR